MRIVDAVRRSIEEDAQDCWSMYIHGGVAHHFHVTYAQCIDRFDAMIFRRLARGLPSILAGMTMVEREDGSMRPWLIDDPAWYEDRRKGPRRGIEFRRPVGRVVTEAVE